VATLALPLINLKDLFDRQAAGVNQDDPVAVAKAQAAAQAVVKASTSIVNLISNLRTSIAAAAGLGTTAANARSVVVTSMTSVDANGFAYTITFSENDAANANAPATPSPSPTPSTGPKKRELGLEVARALQNQAPGTYFTYQINNPPAAVLAKLEEVMKSPESAAKALSEAAAVAGNPDVLVLYAQTAAGDIATGTIKAEITTPAAVQAVAVTSGSAAAPPTPVPAARKCVFAKAKAPFIPPGAAAVSGVGRQLFVRQLHTDGVTPARRALSAHGSDIHAMLIAAGIPEDSAYHLTTTQSSTMLALTKKVQRHPIARAHASRVLAAEHEHRVLHTHYQRHLQAQEHFGALQEQEVVVGGGGSRALQVAPYTPPVVEAMGSPQNPCSGPADHEGISTCTIVDFCYNNPDTCIYGPVGPWSALGAFGADHRPTPVCGLPSSPANCGALVDAAIVDEENKRMAGTSLKGAGLPITWSGLTPPAGASLPWPAFDSDANRGSGLWIGPSARWGRYAQCRPTLSKLTAGASKAINQLQAEANDFYHDIKNDGKVYNFADSPIYKDFETTFVKRFARVYDCFCDATPTCFLGINTLDTNDLMDTTVIKAASRMDERTSSLIARLYSGGFLLRRPPPAHNNNFVDKLYSGLARLIDNFPEAHVAAEKNKWLVFNLKPTGAAYEGPNVEFKWASKCNRVGRLMQVLDASYDQNGVFALSEKSRPDVPGNFYAYSPYGIGAFTWPWTAPCDGAIMGMASAYWKPDVVDQPVSQTPWFAPNRDYSYARTDMGFQFKDFAEDAAALRTCRNAWGVLANWVWTAVATQVAGSAADLDEAGSKGVSSIMNQIARNFPVENLRFSHKRTCMGYYMFEGEEQQYCQSSNIAPSPLDGVVKAIKLATAGYL
jgi:hypothetical protein